MTTPQAEDHQHKTPLRILAVSATWQGANDYAFVRAFRRAGHSVSIVPVEDYYPRAWRNPVLKAVRRIAYDAFVDEYNAALLAAAAHIKPDLFFVFKGDKLKRATLDAIKVGGARAIQFYPDVSFRTHGPHLKQTLNGYDWVFTTKSFGLRDMREQLGVTRASLLHHAYDPEVHKPEALTSDDLIRLGCDVSFIGTRSKKKEALLIQLAGMAPSAKLRVWGEQWRGWDAPPSVEVRAHNVLGPEYAKAIQASSINLALLSEARAGASSGDQITARSFEIPACGAFMLHERTPEAMAHFVAGEECDFFDGAGDLADKVRHYLAHAEDRQRMGAAAHKKCREALYSVDARVQSILEKYWTLRAEA